jgi:hypothetical protein
LVTSGILKHLIKSVILILRLVLKLPRRMRWPGHIARLMEGRGVYGVLMGKLEGKRPLGRPRRRWIFRKWDVGVWTGFNWLRIETGGENL